VPQFSQQHFIRHVRHIQCNSRDCQTNHFSQQHRLAVYAGSANFYPGKFFRARLCGDGFVGSDDA